MREPGYEPELPMSAIRFSVGETELEGLELCEPCNLLARRTHAQVRRQLADGGGLRCRIVRGGTIRVGDAVTALGEGAQRHLEAARSDPPNRK